MFASQLCIVKCILELKYCNIHSSDNLQSYVPQSRLKICLENSVKYTKECLHNYLSIGRIEWPSMHEDSDLICLCLTVSNTYILGE